MKKVILAVALIGSLVFFGNVVKAEANIPSAPVDGYIVDQANILSDEQETSLNSVIANYKRETGVEIGILTVKSIQDDYIENFSLNVARAWGIGQKDKNNGALLTISVDDRKLRIEVGNGLEGDLTDVRAGRIIRERITPEFKKGDYYQGISNGLSGMILAINAQEDVSLSEATADNTGNWIGAIFFAAYMFLVVISWFGSMLGRSKRWWPGGIIGATTSTLLGTLISGTLEIGLISGVIVGLLGFVFDYLVSKNYQVAKAKGESPSWWAGGGFSGNGSGSGGGFSGGFGGGGGFSGGGSSGSW